MFFAIDCKRGIKQGEINFSRVSQKQRQSEDNEKIAKKSHRQRVEEMNEKLGSMTELNDIPRVSAAGNG